MLTNGFHLPPTHGERLLDSTPILSFVTQITYFLGNELPRFLVEA